MAIWNWSGQTQYGTNYGTYPNSSNLVFANNSTLSSSLANISFYSDSGITSIGSGFERGFLGGGTEIIAVPESETYFYAVTLLASFVIQYLRRRAKHREGQSSRMAQIPSRKAQNNFQTPLRSKPFDPRFASSRSGPITLA